MQTLRREHEKKQKVWSKELSTMKNRKKHACEEKKWYVNGDGPCPNEVTGAPSSRENGYYKRGKALRKKGGTTQHIIPKAYTTTFQNTKYHP